MAKIGIRRDSKHRVLRRGESIRWDGKYQFKYHVNGKAHFVYSWRLEPTDKLPAGKANRLRFGFSNASRRKKYDGRGIGGTISFY